MSPTHSQLSTGFRFGPHQNPTQGSSREVRAECADPYSIGGWMLWGAKLSYPIIAPTYHELRIVERREMEICPGDTRA